MNRQTERKIYTKRSGKLLNLSSVVFCTLIAFNLSFYGCGDKPSPTPVPAQKGKAAVSQPAAPQPDTAVEETPAQEGYVYQQRDRRDPFAPLIVPKKKAVKIEGTRVGTLLSYDVSDFTLAAIAQKGGQYFALLTTPDNRSFTVHKGTAIGLYKGNVQEISKNKIIIVEYSSDYRGELKPRQIILEFHKGEVE